ncbi:uncharacterized protein LOC133815229 [Humulus lupulus]|uniref:uncharacterized protein LOC133815229 n=1 Tax=Humulus lupulus TaxID=3486 RepID=UPI002B40ED4A|nr:uncharacterized protein LOC133815229 [Humulus lupulus]
MKGVKQFRKKGKLSPKFFKHYEILERIGQVAYRLALPPTLSRVDNMFHVSMLRKDVSNVTHVLSYEMLELQQDLSYEEKPVQILDRKDEVLQNNTTFLVKLLWRKNKVEEATWEIESSMQDQYPEMFT